MQSSCSCVSVCVCVTDFLICGTRPGVCIVLTTLLCECRQAQDKFSDAAAQAQYKAQQLAHDVSSINPMNATAALEMVV